MKTALLLIVSLALSGCHQAPSQPVPRVDPAPTLEAQAGKDRSIVEWAAKIDASVDQWFAQFPSPFSSDIKAATAAQREEVRKAPATQFNVIAEAYKANADADAKEIAQLKKERDGLRDAERKKQIAWLRSLGIACAVAAGALLYFGQRSFAGLAGFISIILLGAAQLISQPWFDLAFNIAVGVAFLSFLGVGLYEWRQKLKAQRTAAAHDDVITGVEELRALFKNPTADMVEVVRKATSIEEAVEAVKKLGKFADAKLAEHVTESDGTAAIIDGRRRALKLIS